jgi:gas vesicle protein
MRKATKRHMKRCRKGTRKRGGKSFREHFQKAKETLGTHSKNLGNKFNNWKQKSTTYLKDFKKDKIQEYKKWKEGNKEKEVTEDLGPFGNKISTRSPVQKSPIS